jgi:homoserine O-acetyltransferase
MMRTWLSALAAVALVAAPAFANVGLVEKRRFDLPAFTFADGRTVPLTVGYETYGTLNATKTNAILVCHFFGGTSHAAGRYAASDERPGYWDALIGPNAAIDTTRHFVVAVDVPANINTADPAMITSGPHQLDPKTKRPYGATFPQVGIPDVVAVQHRLMTQLGIPRWHAVVGASLGGMQTLQWAVDHPHLVERAVVIAAPGRSDPYNQAMCQVMIDSIEADKNFRGGAYYGQEPPSGGLKAAWKLLYAMGLNRDHMARTNQPFLTDLEAQAARRLPRMDANAWLRLARASRDFDLGRGHGGYEAALGRIQARLLVIPAEGDQLFPPDRLQRDLVDPLSAAGKQVECRVLRTDWGHLGAVYDVTTEAPTIQRFLSQ